MMPNVFESLTQSDRLEPSESQQAKLADLGAVLRHDFGRLMGNDRKAFWHLETLLPDSGAAIRAISTDIAAFLQLNAEFMALESQLTTGFIPASWGRSPDQPEESFSKPFEPRPASPLSGIAPVVRKDHAESPQRLNTPPDPLPHSLSWLPQAEELGEQSSSVVADLVPAGTEGDPWNPVQQPVQPEISERSHPHADQSTPSDWNPGYLGAESGVVATDQTVARAQTSSVSGMKGLKDLVQDLAQGDQWTRFLAPDPAPEPWRYHPSDIAPFDSAQGAISSGLSGVEASGRLFPRTHLDNSASEFAEFLSQPLLDHREAFSGRETEVSPRHFDGPKTVGKDPNPKLNDSPSGMGEVDVEQLMEAIAQAVQADYRRFYGE
ncbi:MAG: hypothetical protein WCD18_26935 [Thermosynechococcaceae cyanobacterium]